MDDVCLKLTVSKSEQYIISSLKPRLGKRFCHKDLVHQKIRILTNARKELIQKCATVEAIRELNTLKLRFNKLVHDKK